MEEKNKPEKHGFAVLMKGFLGVAPYKCILCGDRLRFAGFRRAIMQPNYCQKGFTAWRKNDGCRQGLWGSAPEKWVLG
jgi:hypothetical protein